MGGTGAERDIMIVDEDNNEIGAAPRHDVHTQELWHRAVHCIIYDTKCRLWLSLRDDVVCRDKFDISLTEHVYPGESYEDTARRGLALRLGVDPTTLAPLSEIHRDVDTHDGGAEYDNAPIADYRFMQLFSCPHEGPVTLDARIYKGGEWRSADEIDELMDSDPERFTPHFRKDWSKARLAIDDLLRQSQAASA